MADSKRTDAPFAAEEYAPEVREPDGYRQSDAAIADQVRRQLALEEGLESSGIVIEVKDGEVTISGFVRQSADMQKIESCACLVPGVKLVRNNLTSDETLPEASAPDRMAGAAPKMGKPGYER